MEHYIIPPDQFKPLNVYKEWKSVVNTVDALLEEVARASAWEKCDYKNSLRILRAILKHRSDVRLYLWLNDIWNTATKGCETAFEAAEVTEEDVPDHIQYWSLNVDISLNDTGREELNVPADFVMAGLFLIPVRLISGKSANQDSNTQAFIPGLLLQSGPELSERLKKSIEAGEPLAPREWIFKFRFGEIVQAGRIVPDGDRGTLAAIRFLKEKFVEPRQQFLPRSEQRREEKEKQFIPEIRSVLLRARADDAIDTMTDEQRLEYACHFLVSSHWRRPNRRMKEQLPVFVQSYVKGNIDKPFRPPRETIYRVAR